MCKSHRLVMKRMLQVARGYGVRGIHRIIDAQASWQRYQSSGARISNTTMATRRSTRIAKATLEGKSEAEISSKKSNSSQPPAEPAVNTKKAKQTRRKRVREDEENEEK